MKTIVKNGEKIVVAESASEAVRMFQRQIKARKNAIVNDDPDKYNVWDDEEKEFNSYHSNRGFYDYGDQGTNRDQGTENVP